ncbi:MAG: HDOD domain-containing protein [Planctomycetota bacterium]|nr:HDOD domain-containing protein [Planctomycetota bacterium]
MQAAQILQDIRSLEPFPQAAIRVLELVMNDAESSAVVAVIEQDPGLTGKVLSMANSAMYAPKVAITSIADATSRLGTKTISSIAITSGAASYFTGHGRATSRSNKTLWDECLHVALYAKRLAGIAGGVDPDLAYTVGLIQNVGHIVLDRFLEDERDEIKFRYTHGQDILAAELAVLGMDHAVCGSRLVRRWGFPEKLTTAIQFHHNPEGAGTLERLCGVVGLAESLAFASLSDEGLSMLSPKATVLDWTGGLDAAELIGLQRAVQADVLELRVI